MYLILPNNSLALSEGKTHFKQVLGRIGLAYSCKKQISSQCHTLPSWYRLLQTQELFMFLYIF